jgi:alpha-glucosidase
MKYPSDSNTYAIENQFFYGPSLLINPVTEESSTSVSFFVPQGMWYDFGTQKPVTGVGSLIKYDNVGTSDIPILVEGGSITRALRDKDFELHIAPDAEGKASGTLYLDDGENLVQTGTSEIVFTWDGSKIKAAGTFGFPTVLHFRSVTIYGEEPQKYEINKGFEGAWEYDVGNSKNV